MTALDPLLPPLLGLTVLLKAPVGGIVFFGAKKDFMDSCFVVVPTVLDGDGGIFVVARLDSPV